MFIGKGLFKSLAMNEVDAGGAWRAQGCMLMPFCAKAHDFLFYLWLSAACGTCSSKSTSRPTSQEIGNAGMRKEEGGSCLTVRLFCGILPGSADAAMLEDDAGEGEGGEEGGVTDEVETLVGEEVVGVGSVAEGLEEEMGGEDFGEEGEQDAGMQDEEGVLGEEA